jgi:hypothetical protein
VGCSSWFLVVGFERRRDVGLQNQQPVFLRARCILGATRSAALREKRNNDELFLEKMQKKSRKFAAKRLSAELGLSPGFQFPGFFPRVFPRGFSAARGNFKARPPARALSGQFTSSLP